MTASQPKTNKDPMHYSGNHFSGEGMQSSPTFNFLRLSNHERDNYDFGYQPSPRELPVAP